MNAKLSAENPDWISPQDLVDRARRVLGGIDLDPASSEEANRVVQAETYFDEEADGLYITSAIGRAIRPWNGTVYLNPPGGQVRQFWQHLLINVALGHTTAAIWVGYSLEQLQSLQDADYQQVTLPTSPLHYTTCLLRRRLRFVESEARKESRMAFERIEIAKAVAEGRKPKWSKPRENPSSPTHGNYVSLVFDTGADLNIEARFAAEFGPLGVIV